MKPNEFGDRLIFLKCHQQLRLFTYLNIMYLWSSQDQLIYIDFFYIAATFHQITPLV